MVHLLFNPFLKETMNEDEINDDMDGHGRTRTRKKAPVDLTAPLQVKITLFRANYTVQPLVYQ